jgi:hypothetical protein
MRRARLAVVAGIAAAAIAAAACSDNSSGSGSGVDLSGNYDLVSLDFGGPTTATGQLALTQTNFTTSIHVTVPTDTVIFLAGTYTTKSTDSIYLEVPPPFSIEIPGVWMRNAAKDTLTLNLSFSGTALATVWHKQ